MTERDREQLHRYHDGELAGFERWRFERRLKRSEALQTELASIRDLSLQIAEARAGGDLDAGTDSPDLWASIAAALPAIDAQVEGERARGAVRTREPAVEDRAGLFGGPIPTWALGSAALASAVALLLLLPPSMPQTGGDRVTSAAIAPMVLASPAGAVRYLDSGGQSVMVIEDPAESMTIVWMMDSV